MTGACPPEDVLVRMVEGALAEGTRDSLEAHISSCPRCSDVIAALAPPPADRKFGRYVADRMIAAGGMGEVWAGWDPKLRRDVAIKVVRPDRADPDGRERLRLLREARALAMLTHPNVLAVYDVGEVDGELFLATELVAGASLASHGGATADWRKVTALYVQAARGLAAAHAVGLVHRDVKPQNLLLGGDGRVRVADFGLAIRGTTGEAINPMAATETMSRSDLPITRTGYVAGTPAYMAPEQRFGAPADARTDQYALCVALVEAISGRRPTKALDERGIVALVTERRATEPALEALCAVLARGLAFEPDDRFPDMTALADDVDRVLVPQPKRSRTTAVVAAAVVAAGVAGTGVWLAVRDTAPMPAATAFVAPTPVAVPMATPIADAGVPDSAPPAVAVAPKPKPAPSPRKVTPHPSAAAPLPTGSATTASTPTAAPQADMAILFMKARSAVDNHDASTCFAAVSALHNTGTPQIDASIKSMRAECLMIAGKCDDGFAMSMQASEELGMASYAQGTAEGLVRAYCTIAGSLDERLSRLQAQGVVHVDHAAWCATLVAPARAAASEANTPVLQARAALVLREVAKCRSYSGHCDEANELLARAEQLSPHKPERDEISPKCTGAGPPHVPE